MLRTAQSLPPTGLSTLGFDPARYQTEPPACYGASWQLPGRDSHPLAATSLCSDQVTVLAPPPKRWARVVVPAEDDAAGQCAQPDQTQRLDHLTRGQSGVAQAYVPIKLQFNRSISERRRRPAYQASQSSEKGASSSGGTCRLRSADVDKKHGVCRFLVQTSTTPPQELWKTQRTRPNAGRAGGKYLRERNQNKGYGLKQAALCVVFAFKWGALSPYSFLGPVSPTSGLFASLSFVTNNLIACPTRGPASTIRRAGVNCATGSRTTRCASPTSSDYAGRRASSAPAARESTAGGWATGSIAVRTPSTVNALPGSRPRRRSGPSAFCPGSGRSRARGWRARSRPAFIDREEGGVDTLARLGVRLHSPVSCGASRPGAMGCGEADG
jgi:hypothetical protein